MEWKKPMCALLVAMLILSMSMASISAPPLPKIFVNPPTYHGMLLGEIFTIDIDIFNITNLGVFEFYLGYNTTILDALDAVPGPFPPSPDLTLTINDTGGYVKMAVICSPVSGNGTLATITFNVTYAESASCTLDLYNTVIGDWAGDPIPHEVEDGYYEFLTEPITVATDKPTYLPEENVTIHGNLTLPYDGLLALTVDNPDNLGLVMRTLQRGAAPPPGDIEITDLYPSDSQGNPTDNFTRGGMVLAYFSVYVKNNGIEWLTVTIAVNAYDGNMVPLLPVQSSKLLIAPNSTGVQIAGVFIPAWAYVGAGTVYASVLTDYPKNGGTPYCPEKSAIFHIIDAGGGGAGAPETQGSGFNFTDGNYNFTIKLPPNAKTGGYRVYAGFSAHARPGYYVASSTVFGVNVICVPNHYSTIQEAVDAATPTNNTILVLPGTYNENVNINVNINTSLTLIATDSSDTVINGSGTGSVVTVADDDVEVSRFTIQNSGGSSTDSGILVQNSRDSTIQGNIITSNGYGINVYLSNNTFILDNTLSNNNHGICLNRSTSSTLRKNNMISNNYNFGVLGDSLSDFIHDIDTSNTVEGNPVYYWKNQNDRQVPANAGFVGLVNSNRITLRTLDLTKNVQGVLFAFTDNSLMERVNTINNEYGIYLVQSFGNIIVGGTTSNNVVGVYLKNSNGNVICHNNFTDNTNQVELYQSSNTWDDSTGKGNYWSDYFGLDDGSNNRTIGDGVGDTDLPHLGVDWYPLMNPWILIHDIAITNVTHLLPRSDVTHAYPGWVITITVTIKNEGDFTETSFPITAYYNGNIVKTKFVSDLAPQKGVVMNLTWDTTGISNGTYTIKATADAVPDETVPDQADNNLIDGTVKFNLLGDINSDGEVNILDVKLVKLAYSGIIDFPPTDLNGDGNINILDVKLVKLAYSGII